MRALGFAYHRAMRADRSLRLPLASITREESWSLERALALRTHERRVWRAFTIVAVGLLVASWYSLRFGIGAP